MERDFLAAQQRMLDRYAVSARSTFVDIASTGAQAHALIAGEGPPVVMVSGIGSPGAMWAPLMAQLQGFQLFAVDLPAYGLSGTTSGFAENLRRNAVLFLTDVLDAFDLRRPAFIGNSLGSLWTSWMALERPMSVAALVHVGCPALALDTSAPLPMRLLSVPLLGRVLTRLQPPSRAQVEQLSKMVGEHPLEPEVIDLLVATERLPRFRETFLSALHALLRLRGSRPEMRLTSDQLATIGQPTLLCWGKDDPFGPPAVGERIAATMPNAQLHVVEGGHAPWLRQAGSIGAAIQRFLPPYL